MEEAFRDYLASAPAVQAIVGSRIDWNIRPQSAKQTPAITLHVISSTPIYSDEGYAGLTPSRIQMDHWGATYALAKEASRATTERLTGGGAKFVHQGIEFQLAFKEDEQDETEQGAAEELLHRVRTDIIIMYKENA